MTPEQRLSASIDLTLTYFNSFSPEWRLVKVLTNKRLLKERYNFFKDISQEVKRRDDLTGEATIAQEITNLSIASELYQ